MKNGEYPFTSSSNDVREDTSDFEPPSREHTGADGQNWDLFIRQNFSILTGTKTNEEIKFEMGDFKKMLLSAVDKDNKEEW